MGTAPSSPQDAKGPATRALAIVPARIGSTRLQRKMLLRATGSYLFEHTVRNLERVPALARIVLATDSTEILTAARALGIEALLTSEHHPSGTDRVHEAWRDLVSRGEGPWDVVVNVQGDEPELPARDVTALIAAFADPRVELASLWAPVRSREEAEEPSVVKVVLDLAGDALYFSRASIPAPRVPVGQARSEAPGWRGLKRHIGVYAYRPAALERFCALPPGELERREGLEQLRWLENGGRLRLLEATQATTGIDTPEQYEAFRLRLARQRPLSTPTP